MNTYREWRAMSGWINRTRPTVGQLALIQALYILANQQGWPEWCPIPGPVVELFSGLSREGVRKARDALIDYGVIEYRPGRARSSGSYKLVGFEHLTLNATRLPPEGEEK
jgi:hypothetical protein